MKTEKYRTNELLRVENEKSNISNEARKLNGLRENVINMTVEGQLI
jgi:hypothetical protein